MNTLAFPIAARLQSFSQSGPLNSLVISPVIPFILGALGVGAHVFGQVSAPFLPVLFAQRPLDRPEPFNCFLTTIDAPSRFCHPALPSHLPAYHRPLPNITNGDSQYSFTPITVNVNDLLHHRV